MPGYLLGRFRDFQGETVYIRNVFLPEQFFLVLEERVSSRFGNEGLARLYMAGKRHGYRFCTLARLPKSDLKFSVRLLYEFIQAIYAEKIEIHIDLDQKILTIDTDNAIVTRIKGGGLSILVGGSAGVWGYFLDDFDMPECGVIHIEGGHYVLVCGPDERLRESGVKFYEAHGAPVIGDTKAYKDYNQPPSIIPVTASNLDKLTAAKILSNDKGQLKYSVSGSQLLSVEISLPYELESLFDSELIYEVAKESFLSIGKSVPHQDNREGFLVDLFTACGYGIVTYERSVTSETFRFDGAPWYETVDKSSFPVLRGAIEGFLEGQGGAPAKASFKRMELNNNRLTVVIDLV